MDGVTGWTWLVMIAVGGSITAVGLKVISIASNRKILRDWGWTDAAWLVLAVVLVVGSLAVWIFRNTG